MIYDTPEPHIQRTAYGKYLARAPREAIFKIAVIGDNCIDAKVKFQRRYAEWRASFVFEPDYQI